MQTLEITTPTTQIYTKHQKLICHTSYYGFYRTYPYHIHDITPDSEYVVLDNDKQPVIFDHNTLIKYFKVR
mgnify:CR=1 FL=1